MKAQGLLFQVQDKGYRDFQSKLIPTIPAETIIGVRTPAIRKLAKEYAKDPESAAFLMQLPHTYYDDNGDEIILNTGKTMICIIEDGDSFTFH